MTESAPQASNSFVAIEVGSINTRAQFFDAVEGRYRFVAAGEAASTSGAPAHDLNLGVLEALTQLQSIVGRQILNERGLMVAKGNTDLGVNAVTATFSGGPALKIVTVGLLDAVSLQSVNNLVNSSYAKVVESLSLNDRRTPESIIDAICNNLPDLIVVAGGTNRGASRSVIRLANYLALALKLIPERSRPEILFVGNENLQEEIQSLLGPLTKIHLTANIRPSLDLENLGPAEAALSNIYFGIQGRKLGGLQQLNGLTGSLMTSAHAFGRAVRFLSTVIDPPKGMLGIDLGASSTTVAAAFSGDLRMRVFPDLGMGRGLSGMIAETHLQQIMRWLPLDLDENRVLDYLYNKPLFPHTLPASEDEMAIEMAAARQVMRLAVGKSLALFPVNAIYPLAGTVPWFDRILVSGSTLGRNPRPEMSLMMALDAIQPVGIATIILDQNNLAATIGASAGIDPLMAVQVLESNAFLNLGTVISPVGSPRSGSAVLRVQMVRDGQKENVVEIKEGGLSVIPLPLGKAADLYIQPLQNMNIGLGAGRGGWVRRVVGGAFGIIFDTRGRPVQVPTSFNRRQETLKAWEDALVGA